MIGSSSEKEKNKYRFCHMWIPDAIRSQTSQGKTNPRREVIEEKSQTHDDDEEKKKKSPNARQWKKKEENAVQNADAWPWDRPRSILLTYYAHSLEQRRKKKKKTHDIHQFSLKTERWRNSPP